MGIGNKISSHVAYELWVFMMHILGPHHDKRDSVECYAGPKAQKILPTRAFFVPTILPDYRLCLVNNKGVLDQSAHMRRLI